MTDSGVPPTDETRLLFAHLRRATVIDEPHGIADAIERLEAHVSRIERLLASRTTIYAARRVTAGPLGGHPHSVAMDND